MNEKDLMLLAESYDVKLDDNLKDLLVEAYRLGLEDALLCITDEVKRLKFMMRRNLL